MENHSIEVTDEIHSEAQLIISDAAINYLKETVKWSKFLSIMGFIGTGIMVIMGLFASSIFSTLLANPQFKAMPAVASIALGVVYILMGLLYFFPTLYLLRFSNKTKLAISTKDTNELTEAFKNQKSLYKFMGIMMIITIGIYVLLGAGALILSMFR